MSSCLALFFFVPSMSFLGVPNFWEGVRRAHFSEHTMGEYESFNQALIECVKVAGGSKVVGHKLWPEKAVDAAQRHLLACLNEDKPERLSPEHLLMLLRLARDKGCLVGIDFMLGELSCAPAQPIEPKDEIAELQRAFIESVNAQAKIAERIERAAGRVNVRAVA